MNSMQLTSFVTAISNLISENLSDDELALYSAIFTQIGDTLATISVTRNICDKEQ